MGKCLLDGELIIAVDFDGTITTEPDMGKELILQPHCKEVLQRLWEDGARLILWTCRTGPVLDEALEFLKENGMYGFFSAINNQIHEIEMKYYPHTARKVGADIYYDDKNAMTNIDWLLFGEYIYGEGK